MDENNSNANDSETAKNVESESLDPSKRVVQWGDGRTPDPSKICTARKSSGEPCRKQRVLGATVCATHGGRAPQVKDKARVRLAMAADKLVQQLLGIANDEDVPAAVRLAAIRDALSRIGISERQAIQVEVGATPLFEQILGGLRSESRSARREADDVDPALSWVQEELTAQVVDDADEYVASARITPTEELDVIDAEVVPPQPNTGGLQILEDALATLQEAQPPTAPPAPRRSNPH